MCIVTIGDCTGGPEGIGHCYDFHINSIDNCNGRCCVILVGTMQGQPVQL